MNDGATPLDPDELNGLKISVRTREELDNAEFANIVRGLSWAAENPVSLEEILTISYICKLHGKMFGDVWKWAGVFRKSDKNIGVYWPHISMEMKNTLDDAKTWIACHTYPKLEIAVRLHHRLVKIHPFVNGNGRITRLLATMVAEKMDCGTLPWCGLSLSSINNLGNARKKYLDALKAADNGDCSLLVKFATSEL